MLGHLILGGLCSYGIYSLTYKEKMKIRKIWYSLNCENNLKNSTNSYYKIYKLIETKYGYKIITRAPAGFSMKELEREKEAIESAFKCDIKMTYKKGYITVDLIYKPLENLKFNVIKTEPYELYLGYDHENHIIINMNVLPHLLIAGINGSGKTRMLYSVLTNLMASCSPNEAEVYLCQLEKSDLTVFKDCENVKYITRNLDESIRLFDAAINEMRRRIKVFDNYVDKGILNIESYNKYFKNNKMSYKYIVLEEFSCYTPDGTDTKEEKEKKQEGLDQLKLLIKAARSTGIFIIMALQKTTQDQMPVFIRSQVNNRMTFKQSEKIASENIIYSDEAVKLTRGKAILLSDEKYYITTPLIDFNDITNALKHRKKNKEEEEVEEVKGEVKNFEVQNVEITELTEEEVEQIKENYRKNKKTKKGKDKNKVITKKGKLNKLGEGINI